MVMIMNKNEFILELEKELSYSKDKCIIINDVLENNFFISKQSKNKIIDELMQNLNVDNNEATYIYEVAIRIVKEEVKNKFKHPFKSKD